MSNHSPYKGREKRLMNRWSQDERQKLEENFYPILKESAKRSKRIDTTCAPFRDVEDFTGRSTLAIREQIRRDKRYNAYIKKNSGMYEHRPHWDNLSVNPIAKSKKKVMPKGGKVAGAPSKKTLERYSSPEAKVNVSEKIDQQKKSDLARRIYGVVTFDQYNQILDIINTQSK